ncbi:hypothetical protein L1267_12305 [Pseudoalteromonas sp. OFAV1]|uniref:hypothetical protein n=1 Tax=Pseudoalteromonas sp. OFAV1 TaxID=2908892 RepID=UPI001F22CB9E|nr:hypothetical protein [Pseudoalteromonas sp. OFAV1]MCF2901174.1 hypothetical protein [Pseudoalteromonas sp. OFAV1]
MRYEINKQYLFIRFIIHPISQKRRTSPAKSFRPWLNEGVSNKPEIKNLLCVEHHKVPDEFGNPEDKKHDGFRFISPDDKSATPMFWDNQFPTASYGQTSNDGDRVVVGAEMADDGHSIKDVYEYYDFASCVSHLWKACVKPDNTTDHILNTIRTCLLDIEELIKDKNIGFKLCKKPFGKVEILSIEPVEQDKDTMSISELINIKWEKGWF